MEIEAIKQIRIALANLERNLSGVLDTAKKKHDENKIVIDKLTDENNILKKELEQSTNKIIELTSKISN